MIAKCSQYKKDEHDGVQDMNYDEIPAENFRRTLWAESLKGRWMDPEDISVLEIRTVVKAVFDLLKFLHVHHHRLLLLGGNMGVVVSCAPSLSRSFKLIVQLRKFCSLCLIMNIRVHFGWIPSEFNSSDLASRIFEEGPLKNDMLQFLGEQYNLRNSKLSVSSSSFSDVYHQKDVATVFGSAPSLSQE